MKFAGVVLMILGFLSQVSALAAKVRVERDIDYTSATGDVRRQLNIFHKTNVDTARDVIIFIHGGSWSSGKKETYWWLGRNLARKGFVTAVINYGLAPDNNYERMGMDCAAAVSWVADHIAEYGGNPDRIFLMGHSAGAHLAELINSDPKYLKAAGVKRQIRGLILNDPFGLDMHEYLSTAEKDADYYNFLRTFSDNPQVWTKGSPMSYLDNVHNPHLIFYGAKTYPAIQMQSERINNLLLAGKTSSELHVIGGKKHVGMISQMIFGWNKLYKYIEDFTRRN